MPDHNRIVALRRLRSGFLRIERRLLSRQFNLSASPMSLFYFPDKRRCLIRLTGAEASALLQSVVTNDLDRLDAGRSLYAALLTPQGKYLADFLLIRTGEGDILVDAEAEQSAFVRSRLLMYRLRRDVEIGEPEASDVACLFGDDAPATAGLAGEEGTTGEIEGHISLVDPRSNALGVRVYGSRSGEVADGLGAMPVSREDWDRHRIGLGIPESGIDLVANETFPLEAGLDKLNGIDFHKGCFVGQEVTARMRHKTALRKGLRLVRVLGPAQSPGTPIEGDGKAVGTLRSNVDGLGLAHLRFERAETAESLTAGATKIDLTLS